MWEVSGPGTVPFDCPRCDSIYNLHFSLTCSTSSDTIYRCHNCAYDTSFIINRGMVISTLPSSVFHHVTMRRFTLPSLPHYFPATIFISFGHHSGTWPAPLTLALLVTWTSLFVKIVSVWIISFYPYSLSPKLALLPFPYWIFGLSCTRTWHIHLLNLVFDGYAKSYH